MMSHSRHDHDQMQKSAMRPDHPDHAARQSIVDADAAQRKRRQRRRRWFVLLLVMALLVGLAPTFLSTGLGTRWLVSLLNSRTPGELTINSLQLSWLGGQRVEGIRYVDPTQGLEASADTIDAKEVSLLKLIRGSQRYGTIELIGGHVMIRELEPDANAFDEGEDGQAKIERPPLRLPRGLSGTLRVKRLAVAYKPLDGEQVTLVIAEDEVDVADLRDISFDLDVQVLQGFKQGRVALSGGVLNLFDLDGVLQAERASYDIDLRVADLPIEALGQVANGLGHGVEPGQVVGLLGQGNLGGAATLKGTLDTLASKLTIQTPKLRVAIDQLTTNKTLVASPTSYATLDLDQDGFAVLFPNSGLKLHKPTRIDLASFEMALPVVGEAVNWDAATVEFVLKAGDELAVVDEQGKLLEISVLNVVGGSDAIADKLSFKLTTILSAANEAAQLIRQLVEVDLEVVDPLSPTREIAFFSESLPIGLIDALIGQGLGLPLWLGETLGLDAGLRGEQGADDSLVHRFSLSPEGRLTGTVRGVLTAGGCRFSTPENEPVEVVLTPKAFAKLMEMVSGREGEPALTIERDMKVFLALRDPTRGAVAITTREDKTGKQHPKGVRRFYPDPDRTYLGATIELTPATVFDPKLKKTYELRGGLISAYAPDLRGKTKLRAEFDLWVRPDAGRQGVASLLSWETTVTDLLDTTGRLPLDGQALVKQFAASSGIQLQNVPSGLMDSLLHRQGDLASILGPIVQEMEAGFTYAKGQPTSATVRLNWDETNNQPMPGAWASMKPVQFDVDANQMLTVRGGQDIELEVRVSENFGDRWMGQLHPILFDAKSGDRPVKIKIDGKSFRFPLKDDKMLGSRVEASIDLGTIQFGGDALLGKLMAWADRPSERAVFEPAIVQLVDGKISYDQFGLSVGKVKLRLDGEVDLVSGEIVDMAVRVPGDSLIRVFNELEGVIAKGDDLSIPMTGLIRKPKFDPKLIGQEVARLLARGVIDQQKDKLKDLIREGIGGGGKPKVQGGVEEETEVDESADEPGKNVEEELIEQGLDLIFRRLNRDKDKSGQE